MADNLACLAELCLVRSRYIEAEKLIREAIDIYRQALPSDSFWLARAEGLLGAALAGRHGYDEAETLLVASYASLCEKLGDRSRFTLEVRGRLADLYTAWGKGDKAAEYRAPGLLS